MPIAGGARLHYEWEMVPPGDLEDLDELTADLRHLLSPHSSSAAIR